MNHSLKFEKQKILCGGRVIILIFFVLWELLVTINKTPVYILPAPSRVLKTLFLNPLVYLEASSVTLGEAIVGLIIGVTAGILLASILVLFPVLKMV